MDASRRIPSLDHYRIREGDISDIPDRVAQAVLTAFYNLRAGASNFESGASNFAPNVVSLEMLSITGVVVVGLVGLLFWRRQ